MNRSRSGSNGAGVFALARISGSEGCRDICLGSPLLRCKNHQTGSIHKSCIPLRLRMFTFPKVNEEHANGETEVFRWDFLSAANSCISSY